MLGLFFDFLFLIYIVSPVVFILLFILAPVPIKVILILPILFFFLFWIRQKAMIKTQVDDPKRSV
jgi:hypothetical protein